MQLIKHALILSLIAGLASCKGTGQLVTMSNNCYKMVQDGNAANDAGNYQQALSTFEQVLDKCGANDAKQQGNAGKARALNGLQRPGEAIAAAEAAIKADKNNINGYYERGVANLALRNYDLAAADLTKVLDLTERNRNVSDRAVIYAKLAEVNWKQNRLEEAYRNLDQAIAIDGQNPAFYLQRGDMRAAQNNLDAAFVDYDRAVALGKADKETYAARATTLISAMQRKYNTTNAGELKTKMSSAERQRTCSEIQKALGLGWRDVQMDLFNSLVCK